MREKGRSCKRVKTLNDFESKRRYVNFGTKVKMPVTEL